MSQNPYVFIVGCPRSGTTLLRRMINAHPLVAVTSRETHWITLCWRKHIGVTPDDQVTHDLVSWLANYWRFQYMHLERAELERIIDDEAPSYSMFVSRVFDLYAAGQGKALAGDKTPGYARDMPMLHKLWPAARFIHLIRDGRDVCLSFLDWPKSARVVGRFLPWARDPAGSSALFWESHVRSARKAGSRLGPGLYREIRYEDLVQNPAEQVAMLSEFLGLPFDDRMLLTGDVRRKVKPGADTKHSRLPPTPGLRNWRSQMSREHLERFEAVAGDLLTELGYERAAVLAGA